MARETMSFRVDSNTAEQVEAEAESLGLSKSSYLEQIVKNRHEAQRIREEKRKDMEQFKETMRAALRQAREEINEEVEARYEQQLQAKQKKVEAHADRMVKIDKERDQLETEVKFLRESNEELKNHIQRKIDKLLRAEGISTRATGWGDDSEEQDNDSHDEHGLLGWLRSGVWL